MTLLIRPFDLKLEVEGIVRFQYTRFVNWWHQGRADRPRPWLNRTELRDRYEPTLGDNLVSINPPLLTRSICRPLHNKQLAKHFQNIETELSPQGASHFNFKK